MQLAEIRRVDIEVTSSGADQATAQLDKLGKAHDDIAVASQSTERATLSLERRVESISRRFDLQYRAEQELARVERELSAARAQGLIGLDRQNQLLDLARARTVGLTAANSNLAAQADKLGTAVKASSVQVGGIAAQFQDVAVQLAGGQSPFLIALQQGTQLSGQLEATGGGVKALGAAFMSLLSPMSLMTIGGIAAFGAIVQYATGASSQVETLDDRLKRHTDLIRGIRDAYGDAAAGVDTYAKESARVTDVQLRAVTEKLKGDIAKVAREIGAMTSIAMPTSDTAIGVPQDLVRFTYEATDKFKAFREAVIQLRQGMDDGTISIGRFRDEVAKVGVASNDANVRKLADELITLTNEAFRAEQALGGSARAVGVLAAQAAAGAPALAAYGAALRALQMGVPEMAKVITAQGELTAARKALDEGMTASGKAFADSTSRAQSERVVAAATEQHTNRVRELSATYEARNRVITGAAELEKTFGETLRTTTIAGLEGVAKGNAQAQAGYTERNKQIEESIKLGMTEGEATKLRAQNEAILARELKNVAAAEKSKGGSKSSSGTDGFDSALKRYEDETIALRLQQEQASRTGVELYKLQATQRLQQAALKAGRDGEKGLADDIERTATAYANQRKATEDAIEAQRRMNDAIRETGSQLADLAENLLTGDFASAMKSLGRDTLRNSLSALFTGTGPLASLTGLAPTEKGGVGGIFGADFFKNMSKAVSTGTEGGWNSLFGSPQQGPLMNGKTLDTLTGSIGNLAGALQGVGAIAGAYGIGQSAGSMAQAGIGGGLSGLMGGAALASTLGMSGLALPGIGLALGIGAAPYGNRSITRKEKLSVRAQRLGQ